MDRTQMSDEQVFKALEIVTHKTGKRLEQHGRGAFISKHETFGVIAEEFDELTDELRANDLTRFAEEMVDIAVACVIGLASMMTAAPASTSETDTCEDSDDVLNSNVINHSAVEELAIKAREAMKERAAQSGLVIPD